MPIIRKQIPDDPKIVPLVCPCGKPLSISKFNGEWVLGDFEKMCSVMIYHKDANKVLEKFLELQGLEKAVP